MVYEAQNWAGYAFTALTYIVVGAICVVTFFTVTIPFVRTVAEILWLLPQVIAGQIIWLISAVREKRAAEKRLVEIAQEQRKAAQRAAWEVAEQAAREADPGCDWRQSCRTDPSGWCVHGRVSMFGRTHGPVSAPSRR